MLGRRICSPPHRLNPVPATPYLDYEHTVRYSCNIPLLIFSPVTHTDRCNEIRVLCKTGQLGAGLSGPPRKFCQQPCLQLSVLLAPPFQHSLWQRAGLSWPLLDPSSRTRRRKIEIGQQPCPSPPPTRRLAQATSNSLYRTATIESWFAGHRLSWPPPTACLPSFQSPTTGPPAHCTYTTCCNRLRTATVGVLGRPSAGEPSAVSTFGPDELRSALARLAVSSARLPKKEGLVHMYMTLCLDSLVTCRLR